MQVVGLDLFHAGSWDYLVMVIVREVPGVILEVVCRRSTECHGHKVLTTSC